jgi:hypothetical protein
MATLPERAEIDANGLHTELCIKIFFCSILSEFENFLLCERILINVTICQNETSSQRYRET